MAHASSTGQVPPSGIQASSIPGHPDFLLPIQTSVSTLRVTSVSLCDTLPSRTSLGASPLLAPVIIFPVDRCSAAGVDCSYFFPPLRGNDHYGGLAGDLGRWVRRRTRHPNLARSGRRYED